ncbi:MAG: 50S ribosomal protein L4, partial [Planctomycetota bacterium]|nr:50S ribosomal protein L4 [Planctomycetota bacterium]
MSPNVSQVAICDQKGKVLERRDIPVPGLRMALIKQAVIRQEANRRTGTAATKVRTQVAGSRRKPWRQKGTGRARVGERASPIWRGGGVIFGPHPRDHSQKLPKKARRRALHDALLGKVRDSEVVAIDEFPLDVP